MTLTVKTPSTTVRRPGLLLSDDLFGTDLFNMSLLSPRFGAPMPLVNMIETTKEFVFEVAAPGLERKDFNIELENHLLTVSAEQSEESEDNDRDYYRKEFSFSSFSRTIAVPENVKEGDINAKYENGVLRIHIPKLKESPVIAPKKIPVV